MWCRMYEAAVIQIILQVGQAVPIVGRRFLMQGLGSVCWTLIDLVCLANTSKAPERSIPVLKFSVLRGMIRRLISLSARPVRNSRVHSGLSVTVSGVVLPAYEIDETLWSHAPKGLRGPSRVGPGHRHWQVQVGGRRWASLLEMTGEC